MTRIVMLIKNSTNSSLIDGSHVALRRFLFCVICALLGAGQVSAQDRVALVIGNSAYEQSPLRNPKNDAEAVSIALKGLGFHVTQATDCSLEKMEDSLVEFRRALKQNSVGVLFYAGHGLQVDGENYLVPIDAKLREQFEVRRKCLPLKTILEAMANSECRLKVVILDSCRDNPFKRSWTRSTSGGGLAPVSLVPEGTLIAYSTSPGKTAADGRGANSPFTESLVKVLSSRPNGGLELTEAFRQASRQVKKQTGQIPWMNMEASLEEFYLWKTTLADDQILAGVPTSNPGMSSQGGPIVDNVAVTTPAKTSKPSPAKMTPVTDPNMAEMVEEQVNNADSSNTPKPEQAITVISFEEFDKALFGSPAKSSNSKILVKVMNERRQVVSDHLEIRIPIADSIRFMTREVKPGKSESISVNLRDGFEYRYVDAKPEGREGEWEKAPSLLNGKDFFGGLVMIFSNDGPVLKGMRLLPWPAAVDLPN